MDENSIFLGIIVNFSFSYIYIICYCDVINQICEIIRLNTSLMTFFECTNEYLLSLCKQKSGYIKLKKFLK